MAPVASLGEGLSVELRDKPAEISAYRAVRMVIHHPLRPVRHTEEQDLRRLTCVFS
jgi:hypothetical protein